MVDYIKSNWSDVVGLLLAVFSILFAVNEARKNKALKKTLRFNNWMFFQKTSNLGGAIQKSCNDSKEKDIDKNLFENIVRSDALCGELMKENIRLIHLYEPSFTEKDIERWVAEGKVMGGYDSIFKKYMN